MEGRGEEDNQQPLSTKLSLRRRGVIFPSRQNPCSNGKREVAEESFSHLKRILGESPVEGLLPHFSVGRNGVW